MDLIYFFTALIAIATLGVILYQRDKSVFTILSIIATVIVSYFASVYVGRVFVFLIFAVLVGLLLAWHGRDELVAGRKWFRLLCILGIAATIISLVVKNYILSFSFMIIIIVSAMALWKSYDRKWTRMKNKE